MEKFYLYSPKHCLLQHFEQSPIRRSRKRREKSASNKESQSTFALAKRQIGKNREKSARHPGIHHHHIVLYIVSNQESFMGSHDSLKKRHIQAHAQFSPTANETFLANRTHFPSELSFLPTARIVMYISIT